MSIEIPDFNKIQDESNIDYLAMLDDCYVDLSVEMERPKILLSVGSHEYKGTFYPTPIMTEGEFSAIIAVSKAKKSFLNLLCWVLILEAMQIYYFLI
jgi:hypothetical protein